MKKPSATDRKLTFYYDRWLLMAIVPILCLGLVMVASSSMVISDKDFGYPFHFFLRQLIYLVLGVVIAWYMLRIPVSFWKKSGPYLLLVGILSLMVVLVPGLGHEVNGSTRWVRVGPISVQVSEVVKLCAIVFLAGYLLRREEEVRTRISGFIKPMIILGLIAVLLLIEPDFGAIAVIMATALGMMFLAGVRLWQFLVLFILVLGAMVLLAVAAPYRVERLITFLHPWANAYGSGYQLTQSLIAFGRGGLFGVGLGNSIQKLFYLPEAHTDFLFAVLAEELGLIGELVVIGLFTVLVARILWIGRQAQLIGKAFAAYLAYGFALWIGLQVMINIGVNSGLLPTKGLTLPFMSYGGSSMVISCMVMAILFRIAHENHCATNSASASRLQRSGQHA